MQLLFIFRQAYSGLSKDNYITIKIRIKSALQKKELVIIIARGFYLIFSVIAIIRFMLNCAQQSIRSFEICLKLEGFH